MRFHWYRFVMFLNGYYHVNKYFGFNMSPQSDIEAVCDMISVFMLMMCFDLKKDEK